MKKLLITATLLLLGSPVLAAEPVFTAQDFVTAAGDIDVDVQTIKDVTDRAVQQAQQPQTPKAPEKKKTGDKCIDTCTDPCNTQTPAYPKHPILGKAWETSRKVCEQILPVMQVLVLVPVAIPVILLVVL